MDVIKIVFIKMVFINSCFSQYIYDVDSIFYDSFEFNLGSSFRTNESIYKTLNYSEIVLETNTTKNENGFSVKLYDKDSLLIEQGYLIGLTPIKDTLILTSMDGTSINKRVIYRSILVRNGKWDYFNKKRQIYKTKTFKIKTYNKKYFRFELRNIKRRKRNYKPTNVLIDENA